MERQVGSRERFLFCFLGETKACLYCEGKEAEEREESKGMDENRCKGDQDGMGEVSGASGGARGGQQTRNFGICGG